MKFSEEQTEAIRVRNNCVVTAGAGSGKTAVLSERFLSLLLDERNPAKVDEILTLTFTKKAAGEMKERIYRKIIEKSKEENLSENGQMRLAEARSRFERATVTTIDAFCNEVMGNALPLLGVPGLFTIDPDAVARIRREEALHCLSEGDVDPVLFRLVRTVGYDTLVDRLFCAIGKQFSIFEPPRVEERIRLQLRVTEQELELLLESLEEQCEKYLEDPDESIKALQKLTDDVRTVVSGWENGNRETILSTLSGFSFSGTGGKSNDKRDFCKDRLKRIKETAVKGAEMLKYIRDGDHQIAVARLLDRYAAAMRTAQIRNSVLDYRDVASGALRALKEDKALRARYKKKFRYIMVDEFQDNNLMQKELFYLLAEKADCCGDGVPAAVDLEPDKLFFVGDEKQSIYLFRGADVSVFRKLQNEQTVLELTKNYRSEPDLIRFFNRFFPNRVMPVDAAAAVDHEAVFKELGYRDAENDRCEIELTCIDSELNASDRSYLSARESEFAYIAEWIRRKIDDASFLIDDNGRKRRVHYSDFLVLSRTSSEQKTMERIFRERGIPYASEKKLTLFSESIAVDFLQMVKAAVYPNDRVAYLSFLRSPLVSVPVSALSALLEDRPCSDPAVAEAEEKLERVRSLFPAGSLTDLFRLFWYDFGYRYFVIKKKRNRHYEEFAEYLLSYLNRKEEEGCSVIDLITELSHGGRDDNLFSFSETSDAVSIMTIHKSKGLEAPVVILSQIDKAAGGDRGAAVYRQYRRRISLRSQQIFEEGGFQTESQQCEWLEFDIPPEDFYFRKGKEKSAKIDSIDKELAAAESKRLLYVALTRAESHLLITGKRSSRSETDSFWQYFSPLLSEEAELSDGRGFTLKAGYRPCLETETYRKMRDPELFTADAVEKALETLQKRPDTPPDFSGLFRKNERTASGRETAAAGDAAAGMPLPATEADAFLEESSTFSLFGTLCHNVLEKALTAKDFDLTQTDIASMIDGRLSPRSEIIENVVRRLVGRFLSSPFFREHRDGELLTEKEFLLRREEGGRTVFVSCRADLIIKHPDKVIVVDFKTDRVKIPGFYDSQLSLYAEAAESIFGLPAEIKLVYLRERIC